MQRKLNNDEKKRMSPYVTAFIGATITLVGGFFLSYNYVQAKKVIAYDYMASAFYNGKEVVTQEKFEIAEEEKSKKPIEESKLPDEVTNQYIGYLIIPKINLTKGFLDVRSTENDVEKNILVVNGSNYPDTDRGNLILAGHSGTGWKAFFNELYRLQVSDTAYVTYKDKKYVYKITNIYKQPKTGKLAIYRDYDKTTLTLITCTNNDSATQTIYVAELVSVE